MTAEDILFAGAVADQLSNHADPSVIDVSTEMAVKYHRARAGDPRSFALAMRNSRGGRNLIRLGMEADIESAMQIDLFDLVPEWDATTGQIVCNR